MISAIRHWTKPAPTLLADWSSLCSWQPRVVVRGSRPTWFTCVTGVQLDLAQEVKQARIENLCGECSIKGGKKSDATQVQTWATGSLEIAKNHCARHLPLPARRFGSFYDKSRSSPMHRFPLVCDALKTNLMLSFSLWENHNHYTYIWNQVKAIIHEVKSMVLLYPISHGAFVIPKLNQHDTSMNFVQNIATWWSNLINERSRRWWSSTNSQQHNKPTSRHFMRRIVHDP